TLQPPARWAAAWAQVPSDFDQPCSWAPSYRHPGRPGGPCLLGAAPPVSFLAVSFLVAPTLFPAVLAVPRRISMGTANKVGIAPRGTVRATTVRRLSRDRPRMAKWGQRRPCPSAVPPACRRAYPV